MTVGTTLVRWLKFNAVGGIGIGVQLAALAVFAKLLKLDYLLATGLAVECAVLHNYLWHEHWTWKDRTHARSGMFGRLIRFNLTTGMMSILANLIAMRILVGNFHLPLLLGNLLSIAIVSIANFFLSDLFVFRE